MGLHHTTTVSHNNFFRSGHLSHLTRTERQLTTSTTLRSLQMDGELRYAPGSLPLLGTTNPINCQQIHDWYKNCKRSPAPQLNKGLLDLTGKSTRKPALLQFHHAFSVRFFRPKGSPLRQEVKDLWERRQEKSVIDLLTPFMNTEDTTTPFADTEDTSNPSMDTEDTSTPSTNIGDTSTPSTNIGDTFDRLRFHNAVMR